jgi:hypothetical protein
MLRGLDMGAESGGEPMIIKVTDREPLDADVTLYVREEVPDAASDRVERVLDGVQQLQRAGIVETVRRGEWPGSLAVPSDGSRDSPIAAYDEFVEAVGWESLNPFFERQPGSGAVESVLTVPPVCIAIRDDGELTGLYPRWNDGTHESIEDCLMALAAGDCVENV